MLDATNWFNLVSSIGFLALGLFALTRKAPTRLPNAMGGFLIALSALYLQAALVEDGRGSVVLGLLRVTTLPLIGVAAFNMVLTMAPDWREWSHPAKASVVAVASIVFVANFIAEAVTPGGIGSVYDTVPYNAWVWEAARVGSILADWVTPLVYLAPLLVLSAGEANEGRRASMALIATGFVAGTLGTYVNLVVPLSGQWDSTSIAVAVQFAYVPFLLLAWMVLALRRRDRLMMQAALAQVAIVGGGLTLVLLGYSDFVFPAGRFVFLLLFGIGALRGVLEGFDQTLRFTLSKTTLAALFVAVFFIASEAAQAFFGQRFQNEYFGIAAAGVLVFGISPLMRMADSLASKAVPRTDDAETQFLRALRIVSADGHISEQEEAELGLLADELGLSASQVLRLRRIGLTPPKDPGLARGLAPGD